jgi:hypothetical protein
MTSSSYRVRLIQGTIIFKDGTPLVTIGFKKNTDNLPFSKDLIYDSNQPIDFSFNPVINSTVTISILPIVRSRYA